MEQSDLAADDDSFRNAKLPNSAIICYSDPHKFMLVIFGYLIGRCSPEINDLSYPCVALHLTMLCNGHEAANATRPESIAYVRTRIV